MTFELIDYVLLAFLLVMPFVVMGAVFRLIEGYASRLPK